MKQDKPIPKTIIRVSSGLSRTKRVYPESEGFIPSQNKNGT